MASSAMSKGVIVGQPKKSTDPLEDMYGLRNQAIRRQAADYDEIMGRFRNIYDTGGNNAQFSPIRYDKSQDTTNALAELQDLSHTGGLSGADQQNLRARGMSPIRSMYATAQRDMNRNRRLQGGYSPNFGAVTAKMTRDQSSLIADQMDKVNANIAQMVQSGRLSAAPNYASAAQRESELKHDVSKFNAEGMFNASLQKNRDKLGAAQGMSNLYGTTPALANLYGNQAQNTASFQNQVKQQNIQNKSNAFGKMYG